MTQQAKPSSSTLRETLREQPSTQTNPQPSTFTLQPSTFNPNQPSTIQPSTFNLQPKPTFNYPTFNLQPKLTFNSS